MKRPNVTTICWLLCAALAAPLLADRQAEKRWPQRVLLTNDNGIDDVAIIELARALAAVTEVHVVAAVEDRSGTSNLMSAIRKGGFEATPRDLGPGITAWALDGYPADCVLFALTGPLRDTPPDLVVSGINGGPNLADAWFGSGTIGAARAAAYFGLPAVAVSGVEDDDPAAVKAAVEWTVRLVQSAAVRALRPPQYLTVSLPPTLPTEIRGVELTRRARGLLRGTASPGDSTSEGTTTWSLELEPTGARPAGTDVAAVGSGKIAVVAMRVDEHDPDLHAVLAGDPDALPAWVAPDPPSARPGSCRSGLGLMVGEAEDDRGNEWGVLVGEILPEGRGEAVGLRQGDVLIRVDEIELAQPGREDPDERLVRLFGDLECGRAVRLTYVRDGQRLETSFMPVPHP